MSCFRLIFRGLPRFAAAIGLLVAVAACDSVETRVEQHQSKGMELVAAGDDAKAALEFRNALKLDENYAPARFELAQILMRTGDVRGAVGNYLKVVEVQPDHREARLALANIMLQANQLEQAMTHAEAAYKAGPPTPQVLVTRALVSYRQGNKEAARKDVQAALELEPDNADAGSVLVVDARDAGNTEEALQTADKFLAKHPEHAGLNMLKLQLLQAMNDDQALGAHLGEMVSRFPENVGVHKLRGAWLARSGDLGGAEAELRTLQELQPGNMDAVHDLIQFLITTQDAAAGRAELEDQIAKAPEAGKLALQEMLAQFDYQSGDKDKARASLQTIIDRGEEPAASDARLMLAQFFIEEKKPQEARALVDQVLAVDAKNAQGLMMRAALRAEEDSDLEGAVLDIRGALNEAPENVDYLMMAGRIYDRNGDQELAGESYASAMRLSNYDPARVRIYTGFLARNNQGQAIATVLNEAVRRHPRDRDLLSDLAAVRLSLKDWDGAEQAAAALRKLDGVTGTRAAAAALRGQGKSEESLALLEDLADPSRPDNAVMSDLVQGYVASGKTAEAEDFLDKVIASNPDNVLALRLRGGLYRLAGADADAESLYRRALDAAPDEATGYLSLVSLYQSQGQADKAGDVLRQGLEHMPDNGVLRLQYGNFLLESGDVAGATAEFETLYEQQPNSLLAANNLASVLSDHAGDDPQVLARAIEIAAPLRNADNPIFQDTYGWLLYQQGEYEEALRLLQPVADRLENNAWVQFHAGMTYARLGQGAAARTHLEAARRLGAEILGQAQIDTIAQTLQDLPGDGAADGTAPADAGTDTGTNAGTDGDGSGAATGTDGTTDTGDTTGPATTPATPNPEPDATPPDAGPDTGQNPETNKP